MSHNRATSQTLGDEEPYIYKKGPAFGMPGVHVDGMDVLKVREVALEAIARARRGDGPTLIECETYRFRGHSLAGGWRCCGLIVHGGLCLGGATASSQCVEVGLAVLAQPALALGRVQLPLDLCSECHPVGWLAVHVAGARMHTSICQPVHSCPKLRSPYNCFLAPLPLLTLLPSPSSPPPPRRP